MVAQLLAGLLAVMVGLGSITLYLAAFFFPEVHRRHDFFWSGVGCFYALVLWLDAAQLTPTEILGHGASISLMGWLGWQTLTLRRKRTPLALKTPFTADSWPTFRQEMTALALDVLRQTPLRHWLPHPDPSLTSPPPGLRISALKEVGYEFVDPVDDPEEPSAPRITPPRERPSDPVPPRSTNQPSQEQTPNPTSPPPKPTPVQMTWGQRGQALVTWLQELVPSKPTPKPKRAVIDIPPRPSSLAKRPPASVPPAKSPPASTPQSSHHAAADSPLEPSPPEEDEGDWI